MTRGWSGRHESPWLFDYNNSQARCSRRGVMDQVKHRLGIAEIIGDKRAQIQELARKYGADNVRVFGSVARGEATSNSDIDLLVSFPSDRSIFDLVGLWLDLTDLLGREVDLSTDESLKDYVRPYAMKDAIPL